MNTKTYLIVSGVIFGAVAVLHALRILNQWSAQIAEFTVPFGASWIGVLVAAGLCVWAFRLARR